MTNPTTPRMLDPDEAQLLTLVREAEAAQVVFQTDGNVSRLLTTREAILAHYRSSKTRSGPQQVFTAADGSQWVEDRAGEHGWWSRDPGGPDSQGAVFMPAQWRSKIRIGPRVGEIGPTGEVLRYYRKV